MTGSLDFQQAPGHRSRGLTTSHIWDCQKLPQKSPPRGPVGIAGEESAIQSGAAAGAAPGSRPRRYLLARAGPGPLPLLQLPARTFPSITPLLRTQPTGPRLPSQAGREKQQHRERPALPEMRRCPCRHPLSVEAALPGTSRVNEERSSLPSQATSRVATMRCPRRGSTRSCLSSGVLDQSPLRSHLVLCSRKLNSPSKACA